MTGSKQQVGHRNELSNGEPLPEPKTEPMQTGSHDYRCQ